MLLREDLSGCKAALLVLSLSSSFSPVASRPTEHRIHPVNSSSSIVARNPPVFNHHPFPHWPFRNNPDTPDPPGYIHPEPHCGIQGMCDLHEYTKREYWHYPKEVKNHGPRYQTCWNDGDAGWIFDKFDAQAARCLVEHHRHQHNKCIPLKDSRCDPGPFYWEREHKIQQYRVTDKNNVPKKISKAEAKILYYAIDQMVGQRVQAKSILMSLWPALSSDCPPTTTSVSVSAQFGFDGVKALDMFPDGNCDAYER